MKFFGEGVLRGMRVTIKNFFDSYFKKLEDGGLFTVEYPEKRLPEREFYRNLPFLVYDETPENPRCTACDICAKECPPKCIYIVRDTDKDGKPLKRPAIFDIDASLCMNCGFCEEVCPFDSIYLDHAFEVASYERMEKMIYHKETLLKSAEYLKKIKPTAAHAVEQKRHAAEEKKKQAAQAAAAAKHEPKAPS